MLDELPAGGDSNFELSTLTLKVLDGSIYLTGHVLVNDALSMDIYYQSGTHLVEVVLYKHLGIFYLYNQTSQMEVKSFSGNCEHLGNMAFMVSGDCEVTVSTTSTGR